MGRDPETRSVQFSKELRHHRRLHRCWTKDFVERTPGHLRAIGILDQFEPRRVLPAVVVGEIRIIIRQFVTLPVALQVERSVRADLVVARELSVGQERGFEVFHSRHDGGEKRFVSGGLGDLHQSEQGILGLSTTHRRRLEGACPDGVHLRTVLLRPGRLGIG